MSNASTSINDLSQNNFRVGQVLSRTFRVYFGNFLRFTLIGAAAYTPLFLFFSLVPLTSPEAQITQSIVSFVFYLFISPLATATIVYAAFQHMRGDPFSLGGSVARGLSRALPLIVLSFLWVLGITIGFALLIIPGLILLLMWYVVVPCCVVERTGPLRSFGRSRELTKGVRWKLFGLLLVVFIVLTIVGTVGNAIWGLYFNVFDMSQLSPQEQLLRIQQMQSSVIHNVYNILVASITLAFNSVLVVVTYYYLRQYKEGVDIEAIASVFD